MRVLEVGGAGYIGSHTVRLLNHIGHEVWVIDNLSTGHAQSVPHEQLIFGEMSDGLLLESVLRDNRIEAVIHFAAFTCVGESVQDPAKYYQNNISATLGLFESMRKCSVAKFVFSSTTATYGLPEKVPTPDGTCIRDYIHVEDLATAHLAALEKLELGKVLQVNLGTGVGNSVLEVIEACQRTSGHPIPVVMSPRRSGDSAELVADCTLAKSLLGWEATYKRIDQMVETAWNWHRSCPRGYASEARST